MSDSYRRCLCSMQSSKAHQTGCSSRHNAFAAPHERHRRAWLAVQSGRQLVASAASATEPAVQDAQAQAPRTHLVTGGRLGSSGSGRALLPEEHIPLQHDKHIVMVRHGQTTWNLQNRIQGSTNESQLTERGRQQARSRNVLAAVCASWLPVSPRAVGR
jgi:Histidine phosphatase superfamily (branch 1)